MITKMYPVNKLLCLTTITILLTACGAPGQKADTSSSTSSSSTSTSSSSSSTSSSSSSSSSSSGTADAPFTTYCDWYGTITPVCVSQTADWGFENETTCIGADVCITFADGSNGSSSSNSTSSTSSSTSSSSNGGALPAITVQGNQVMFGGQASSISGPSLFWSNTGWGGERFFNEGMASWVKQDWGAKLVRAPLGVDGEGGYLVDGDANKQRVTDVVDAAIANDMYVIIDWHTHYAEQNQSQAIQFFTEMANRYGDQNNVIYEIYNEPLQVSWSNVIKPYAEAVISAIRAIDPDNLIIVGTPAWSQDVDEASYDPITSHNNIAYTLHFYSGTHKQFLRDKAQTALNNGIALFVTEWGSVDADGDGAVDQAETNLWMNFLKQNNISHANWALNDKAEGASALQPNANANGNWSDNELTQSGKLVKGLIKGW